MPEEEEECVEGNLANPSAWPVTPCLWMLPDLGGLRQDMRHAGGKEEVKANTATSDGCRGVCQALCCGVEGMERDILQQLHQMMEVGEGDEEEQGRLVGMHLHRDDWKVQLFLAYATLPFGSGTIPLREKDKYHVSTYIYINTYISNILLYIYCILTL